jgi:hypothetical protein
MVALFAAIALSGCSSGSGGFQTYYGQPAVDLARHIPACSQTSVGQGLADKFSAATCVIDGRRTQFLSYVDDGAMSTPITTLPHAAEAIGRSWTAWVTTRASASVQRRILRVVVGRLGGEVRKIGNL